MAASQTLKIDRIVLDNGDKNYLSQQVKVLENQQSTHEELRDNLSSTRIDLHMCVCQEDGVDSAGISNHTVSVVYCVSGDDGTTEQCLYTGKLGPCITTYPDYKIICGPIPTPPISTVTGDPESQPVYGLVIEVRNPEQLVASAGFYIRYDAADVDGVTCIERAIQYPPMIHAHELNK